MKSPVFTCGLGTLAVALLAFAPLASADTLSLSSLDLRHIEQEYGQPGVNVSVEKHPLRIGGQSFAGGVGTHGRS